MSNWLGFSLTPHLRIEEEDHDSDAAPPPASSAEYYRSVMPLRSDGSLSILHPFHRSHEMGMYDKRVETSAEDPSTEEAPKLEDFLGSCYATSSAPVYPPQYASFQGAFTQNAPLHSSGGNNLLCCAPPYDGAGFKSWLRAQQPCTEINTAVVQVQSLDTAVEQGKKRGTAREAVARKSIDTFGQRTSQYRGVTSTPIVATTFGCWCFGDLQWFGNGAPKVV